MDVQSTTALPARVPQLTGFVVQRKIGQGASAVVWLARREDALFEPLGSESLVALKIPRGGDEPLSGEPYNEPVTERLAGHKPESGVSPVPLTRRERRAQETQGDRDRNLSELEGGAPNLAPAEVVSARAQEEYILSRFRHENLVKYLGTAETSHGRGYVMEYAAGGSLLQMISATGPLPVGQAVTVAVGVARAVDFLHQAGVSHRDISPSNVVFDAEGRPLLSDFGFAHVFAQTGKTVWGTPGFADPFMASGAQVGTSSSDVYSLGALVWFMLTGEVPGPESGRTPLTVMLPEVNPDLVSMVEAALAEDPGLRPSARDFAQELYRSHQPMPVDVTLSAHASDLPLLLTRRAEPIREERQGMLSCLRTRLGTSFRSAVRSVHSRVGLMATAGTAKPSVRAHRADPRATDMELLHSPDAHSGTGSTRGSLERRIAQAQAQPASGQRWMKFTAAGLSLAVLAILGLVLGPAIAAKVGSVMGAPSSAATAATTTLASAEPTPTTTAAPQPKSSGDPGSGPTVGGPGSDPDPVAVLRDLVAKRQDALAARSVPALDAINVMGSTAMDQDRATIEQLAAAGLRYQGLELSIAEARVIEQSANRAVIATVLKASPYQVVGAGRTVAKAASSQSVTVTLSAAGGQWRIESVSGAE